MKQIKLPLLISALGIFLPDHCLAQMLINGAGATFPYPLYSKWFDEYATLDPSVRFNYQSIGSGGGQKQILAQTVDFGASDGPMSDENLAKAPGKLLHIPTVAGAVVVTFNLSGVPTLKLDGPTVADIFQGKITSWRLAWQSKAEHELPITDQRLHEHAHRHHLRRDRRNPRRYARQQHRHVQCQIDTMRKAAAKATGATHHLAR